MLINKYFCIADDRSTNKYSYYGYNLMKTMSKDRKSDKAQHSGFIRDDNRSGTKLKTKLKTMIKQRSKSTKPKVSPKKVEVPLEDDFEKMSSTQNSKFRTTTTFRNKRNSEPAPLLKFNQENILNNLIEENVQRKKNTSFRNIEFKNSDTKRIMRYVISKFSV